MTMTTQTYREHVVDLHGTDTTFVRDVQRAMAAAAQRGVATDAMMRVMHFLWFEATINGSALCWDHRDAQGRAVCDGGE